MDTTRDLIPVFCYRVVPRDLPNYLDVDVEQQLQQALCLVPCAWAAIWIHVAIADAGKRCRL